MQFEEQVTGRIVPNAHGRMLGSSQRRSWKGSKGSSSKRPRLLQRAKAADNLSNGIVPADGKLCAH